MVFKSIHSKRFEIKKKKKVGNNIGFWILNITRIFKIQNSVITITAYFLIHAYIYSIVQIQCISYRYLKTENEDIPMFYYKLLKLTTRRDSAVLPPCSIVRGITPWPFWLSVGISAVVTTSSKDFIVRQRVFMWILRTPSLTGKPRDGDVFKSNVLFAELSYLTI